MPSDDHVLNTAYLETLYEAYLKDSQSVPTEWRRYFAKVNGHRDAATTARTGPGPSFQTRSIFASAAPVASTRPMPARGKSRMLADVQHSVDQLIRNYRVRGHNIAQLDPLGLRRTEPAELSPGFYGFTEDDLNLVVSTRHLAGPDEQTVRQLIERMQNTYCRYIGVQFMHIDDLTVREWLQNRMEGCQNRIELTRDEQLRILRWLTDAVVFERFLQKKYVGAKSFSLEGAESLIPLLDMALESAGEHGVNEVVMAMAHRGRLNVLATIMGKPHELILREFEDADPNRNIGAGDVKYHLGRSTNFVTSANHQIHVSLCFNPSHLEFINPVAAGRVRAKQDRSGDAERNQHLAIIIHGDAAFAGEGVVQETLNLSQLDGYGIGGALHVVVNNQIGFTTSPNEARSCVYATDVAKMLQSPIFHVNGEDPEAVAQVIRLAMDFRRTFKRDVFVDMYCYRRRGHNEGDEPAFTQPVLYKAISERKPVPESYEEHLLALGAITAAEAEEFVQNRTSELEEALEVARSMTYHQKEEGPQGVWSNYVGGRDRDVADLTTGVAKGTLTKLSKKIATIPKDFHINRLLKRLIDARTEMAEEQRPFDWAAAELLAFATLLVEGAPVRFAGQDSIRGTFSQRHAAYYDSDTGDKYDSLAHLSAKQAPVQIINSPLSEAGVMGFEWGYSLDTPQGLNLWEAQFGDFCNAAQVIIDQFITSAEDKWNRLSGITLLLPHGFEGQGPEHSSARLERWLVLGAEDNIQVCYPSTPAQYFHLLRRQVVRPLRKPLVVMTPKSLLRNPEVVSPMEDMAEGVFKRVIPDSPADDAPKIDRVILCSGKIYYELMKRREQLKWRDVAIVRLEQLYPLPVDQLRSVLAEYADGTRVFWVQEEPRNMGAWPYLSARLGESLFNRLPLSGICRPESASPATGSLASHRQEQEQLITQAIGG